MALEFLYRGLTYRTPSGELCCDIGKHFFDRKKWEQAVFWYRNALQVSENAKTGGFVEKECYGYIPCIQLSVCWYYLGDIEKAFQYHCQAGTYKTLRERISEKSAVFYLSQTVNTDYRCTSDYCCLK